MISLTFTVGCPSCGGELDLVNPGAATGTESKVVTRCHGCKRDYLVYARIAPTVDYAQRCAS